MVNLPPEKPNIADTDLPPEKTNIADTECIVTSSGHRRPNANVTQDRLLPINVDSYDLNYDPTHGI